MDSRIQHVNAEVVKVDSRLRLVYGWAVVSKVGGSDYYDLQGDHIPEDVMEKGAFEFTKHMRVGKEMHAGKRKGTVVFSFPLTSELAEKLEILSDKSGWLVGMHVEDDDMLSKFESGEYTGFSIGAFCSFEAVAEAA